jgi:NTE family protein
MNFPTLLIAKCDRFVKSVRYCVLQSLSKLHLSTCCFVTEQGQSIGGLLCYHLRIHLKQLLSWSFHRPTFSQHHLIHLFLLEVFHQLFYLPVLCEVRRDVYNEKDQTYDLNLQVKMEANLSVRVGGNVSSSGSNQVYFGASYQNLNYYSKEFNFDGQLGRVYNNVQLAARIDFPTKLPTSYKFIASISTFDYFKEAKFFSNKDNPAFNKKREEFVKLKVSLPFLSRKKAEFGVGIARMEDRYFQTNIIDFSETKHDESTYSIFGGSIVLEGSTLNARQFATQGSREKMAAQIFTGTEHFRSGVSKVTKGTPEPYKKVQSWLQVSYQNETYHKVSPKFTLGTYLEAYYSSRNFSNNYTATLMQAGEFTPTAHSKVTYNEAFRANQYAGVGAMPIYQLSESFQLRGEFYGFIPIFPIKKDEYGQAYYGKAFTKFEYLGEISLVFQLSFGSISAYVNHYSSPSNDWNVGLTLGWQLFNSRFVE